MAKYLVVVESPAKARTINKFLGPSYIVRASNGHVRDLPKNELGVDIENNFLPKYVRLSEASKAIKGLQEAAKKVERILVASDPDREGEAIGWHVAALLERENKPIERIVFNAITKRNVLEAAKHPRPINENLVNAQQARRVLDRLVGYKLSPLLQWSVQRGLSAGRVQSVAVRMVCDREAEIRAFVAEEYWTIDATLRTPRGETFMARLNQIRGEKAVIPNAEATQAILRALEGAEYRVASVERKEVRRRPYPPFITSTLQQEALRKLRLRPRQTMRIAQQLYEGVDLGEEGRVGIITYMRTDSTRLDPEALDDVRAYIRANFEPDMLPEQPNFYKGKKDAQDAHEAIRPTVTARTPDSIRAYLDNDQYNLYLLIWQRFVASQMTPAVLDQTTIDTLARAHNFRATGSVMKFPGFTKLYEESVEENGGDPDKSQQNRLPEVFQDEILGEEGLQPEQHFTKPPARYTEAGLIRALEENGIGRPSTYAPIINTITERGYVEREKGRLKPTDLGEKVNKLLVEHFPDILDIQFTARMEEDLDHVEEGRREWHDLLRDFYAAFEKDLTDAQCRLVGNALKEDATCPVCGKGMEMREGRFGMFIACVDYPKCKGTRRVTKPAAQETDQKCEQCGAPMLLRHGRFGPFMACSTYPKCKNTYSLDKDGNKVVRAPKEPPQKTDQRCPDCGAFLLIRKNRRGEPFYGCEKYPKCKFTKPMELGLKCLRPGCDGDLVSKVARGRRFVGCNRHPQCDFAVFGQLDKATPCPKCGNSWTYTTKPRNKPQVRHCPVPGCGYEEHLPEESPPDNENV
ncbi:MAG TPA: type I DNA topoisomerase [Candidatus Hydrogenedentes bacterium]|nr:type I DNA topoisomerase [Candidatus Hydrogenedentota bacterium]